MVARIQGPGARQPEESRSCRIHTFSRAGASSRVYVQRYVDRNDPWRGALFQMAQQVEEPRQATPGLETQMAQKPDHGEESYRGFGRMQGKAALITGGDSGIGRAI